MAIDPSFGIAAFLKAKSKKKSLFGYAKFEKGSGVPFGKRPFAARALPDKDVKAVRAKAPRYGVMKGAGARVGGGDDPKIVINAPSAEKVKVKIKIKKSCDDCGRLTFGDPLCTQCFRKALALEKGGYAQTCGSCHGKGCATCGKTGKVTGNASAGMRGGQRMRLITNATSSRTAPGHTMLSTVRKGLYVRVSEMVKSTRGKIGYSVKDGFGLPKAKTTAINTVEECGDCGFAGTGSHRCPMPNAIRKSMEFVVLDENDPTYHGHEGGGMGYSGKKWIHMHPETMNSDDMITRQPKEEHRHFKAGAWTTGHSPDGYRSEVLARRHDANESDPLCALPNCRHRLSQHVPTDAGYPGCKDCNNNRPRRNVRHSFRSA